MRDHGMQQVKRLLRRALLTPGLGPILRPIRRGTGTILMLGRLADPSTGAIGLEPNHLRRTLAFLRRRGYELVGLGEMFRRLREGPPSDDLGVALTLDDGYAEQVRVAGPILAEFDCPATVFLTTGFLDQALWQWWDRIEYVFERSGRPQLETTVGDARALYRLGSKDDRALGRNDFTARCKRVPEEEKLAAIIRLADAAEVELPIAPPPRYAAMHWSEAIAWESKGMTFAPHTVTHPVLSRVSDRQSEQEIADSWTRLRDKLQRPVPIFCYPNGEPQDQGPREWSTLAGLGMDGAITATEGYASVSHFRERPENAFAVRHFALPDDCSITAQITSGADRLLHPSG